MPRYAKQASLKELSDKINRELLDYNSLTIPAKDLDKITMPLYNYITPEDKPSDINGIVDYYVSSDFPIALFSSDPNTAYPVYFAVYLDIHNHLRAYIPKNGNSYDKSRKRAYDVNIHTIEENFYEPDLQDIIKDIFNRIEGPNGKVDISSIIRVTVSQQDGRFQAIPLNTFPFVHNNESTNNMSSNSIDELSNNDKPSNIVQSQDRLIFSL